ncbi:MAG: hypothetical protein R3E98_18800 [Gemmatimonadota bacterium]
MRAPALLPCVLAVVACGGAPDAPSAAGAEWTVDPEPVVTLGGADERPEQIVHEVVGATRLDDGRIVVALQGASEVKIFGPDGAHLRTVGGPGGGPGEFSGIHALARLPADTLLVLSERPGLTLLSADGDHVRSLRTSLWGRDRHPCRMAIGRWDALPDGRWVTVLEDNPGQPGCTPLTAGIQRPSGLLELQDAVRGRYDTLAVMPGAERNAPMWRVYGADLVWAAAEDRLYVADSRSERIASLSLDGDTLAWLPTPFAEVQVPPEATRVRQRPSLPMPPGYRPPIPMDPPYDYPSHYPRLGRLLVDRTGALWVMAYPAVQDPVYSWRFSAVRGFEVEEGGARWRVLDPTGRPLATVRTPPGVFPLEIGSDYVLGLTKDAYDVEAVVLHRLVR